jgi:hypothetical protein
MARGTVVNAARAYGIGLSVTKYPWEIDGMGVFTDLTKSREFHIATILSCWSFDKDGTLSFVS